MSRILSELDIEVIKPSTLANNRAGLGKAENTIRVPYTAREACEISMAVNKMVMEVFTRLNQKCRPASQKVIKTFMRQCEQEADFLTMSRNYYLNCDLARFYESGGLTEPEPEYPDDERFIQEYFNRFVDGLEELTEAVIQCGSDYLDELTVYSFCISIAEGTAELYHRMYKMYPEGQMQQVLEDIYHKKVDLNFNCN